MKTSTVERPVAEAAAGDAERVAPRMFLELALVLGLPLLAVFISSALVIAAYTKGFTPLPEPPALNAHHHR